MKVGELSAGDLIDAEYYVRLEHIPHWHVIHSVKLAGTYKRTFRFTDDKVYFKIRQIIHSRTDLPDGNNKTSTTLGSGSFGGPRLYLDPDTEIGIVYARDIKL